MIKKSWIHIICNGRNKVTDRNKVLTRNRCNGTNKAILFLVITLFLSVAVTPYFLSRETGVTARTR